MITNLEQSFSVQNTRILSGSLLNLHVVTGIFELLSQPFFIIRPLGVVLSEITTTKNLLADFQQIRLHNIYIKVVKEPFNGVRRGYQENQVIPEARLEMGFTLSPFEKSSLSVSDTLVKVSYIAALSYHTWFRTILLPQDTKSVEFSIQKLSFVMLEKLWIV